MRLHTGTAAETIPAGGGEKPGFYPQILGYDFKQEPLNPAIAPLTPRTDRMIVRVRQEGLTAIRPWIFADREWTFHCQSAAGAFVAYG